MVSQSPSKLLHLSPSSSATSPDRSPFTAGGGGSGGVNYIQHPVSKFDTLAGVAIKYGVDVADIKRINGLVTDLQMFALKTLHIPLPGRHPPSPSLSNGFDSHGPSSSEQTQPTRRNSDLFESFQSLKLKSTPPQKISEAMSSLQDYYGLKSTDDREVPESIELAVYRKEGSHYLEDGPFMNSFPFVNPPLSHHTKSKSGANGFLPLNGECSNKDVSVTDSRDTNSEKWIEKMVRRRQKSEADFSSRTPEMLLKQDGAGSGGFSSITGKGLALRPNATSRTSSGVDTETGWQNSIPVALGDSLVAANNSSAVRKSSSTSSLQDSDNSSSSSIWPSSKWSLKSDLQAFSNAAMTMPIFDGLPKPPTGRRNKAALD